MELRDLVQALRRFWLLALGVVALCVAAGAAAAFLPAEKYRAKATLIAEPRGQAVDFSSVEAVNFLLPSLVEEVRTDSFRSATLGRLPIGAPTNDVTLDAQIQSGTAIFRISAESGSPLTAALAANAAAQTAISRKISSRFMLSLLDVAQVPSSPASPQRVPILFGATALGLILALFSVLGANAVRRRLRSGDELRERFGLEVLAEVPAKRRFPATASALFEGQSHPDLVEAFQRLRTNLELSARENPFTIAVTSSAPGEGKSTVTANLAWALASLGHRVVAVDCDLRRPSLHRYLGGRLERGMSEIAKGAKVGEMTQPTGLKLLRVVSAGTVDAHPAQILQSALPKLFKAAEGRVVVVDTPPMLGVSEAALVATMTDFVLLVVDARRRDPAELERVLHELSRGQATVVGAVVNRSKEAHTRYASSYYHYPIAPAESGRRRRADGT